jgi:hypothetical protein
MILLYQIELTWGEAERGGGGGAIEILQYLLCSMIIYSLRDIQTNALMSLWGLSP